MRGKNKFNISVIAAFFMVLLISSSLAPITASVSSSPQPKPAFSGEQPTQSDTMTFTSGETISFTSTETMTISTGNKMTVWSGVTMNFSSTTKMQFVEFPLPGDGVLMYCDWLQVVMPGGYLPDPCSWWEVFDPITGKALGEFHVDFADPPALFHIDNVWPGPIQIPIGAVVSATMKIDVIEPCKSYEVHDPAHWYPAPCSWWEIINPETGQLTGYEFHVDWTNESCEFHIDEVIPRSYELPFPWPWVTARLKIASIEPCTYLVVEEPPDWYPAPCTWWELLDESGQRTGTEFHVDWTNESCEFHIDEVWPSPIRFPEPGIVSFVAEQKVTDITTCDWFVIESPAQYAPEPCTWWEILDPSGHPTGLEFHVDTSPGDGTFHVDIVTPNDPIKIPWIPPTVTITVAKKTTSISQCNWFRVTDPTTTPTTCSWWRVTRPDIGDVEFHVDTAFPDGTFHVDIADPITTFTPTYMVSAERKVDSIQPCNWFTVKTPSGYLPQPCTWWKVISPSGWDCKFHVDATDGISRFHVDEVKGIVPEPTWEVTVENFVPPVPWFKKPPHIDYAPSGMPDFDEKQDQWGPGWFTWCGPVSIANSLWWLDSEYESLYTPAPIPPPFISDHFPLVTSYNPQVWDDHDPQNLDPLVRNLAFLMDADGMRTGLAHQGVSYIDMQTGLSQYLQQQGVNPPGDCDGDGDVDDADMTIIQMAFGSMPGMPNWDMRADIVIDNNVNMFDLDLAAQHYGQTGLFYEHTEPFPEFRWIEDEIYRCEDVVLFLEFWVEMAPGQWMEFYELPSFEAGHFVTSAGVNSSELELLISDPWWDAAESGFPGDVPVAHPPVHPSTLHNDALYVSHDAYDVLYWNGMPPGPISPYGPGIPVWELVNYLPQLGYPANYRTFIRAAVVTSPLGEHDVAVTDITTSKTGCLPKETLGEGRPIDINVTVTNEGDFTETFNVTVYTNSTLPLPEIARVEVTLLPAETTIIILEDEIVGGTKGGIRIIAVADTVPGETDTADNTRNYDKTFVTIAGDVDGDRDVDIFDIVRMAGVYGVKRPNPRYNPNCDLDNDGDTDIFDIVIAAGHYGQHW